MYNLCLCELVCHNLLKIYTFSHENVLSQRGSIDEVHDFRAIVDRFKISLLEVIWYIFLCGIAQNRFVESSLKTLF